MSFIGLVLLVAAAVGFCFTRKTRGELHAMTGAETLPVSQLEVLRRADRGGPQRDVPGPPEQVLSRFEPHQAQGPSPFGLQLPKVFDTSGAIGYECEERVIRPGTRLYVLGEVRGKIGPLVIGKPEDDGHFLLSTGSEQELRDQRGTSG